MMRSSALRLPKSQTNGFTCYTNPLGNPPWTWIGAARHHSLLIVNPAQGIPPIVSKIMFAFWCLTVELCSSHVFRFFSVTGGLGAWALFSFFRSFSSIFFFNFNVLWLPLGRIFSDCRTPDKSAGMLHSKDCTPFAAQKVFSEEM